MWKYLKEIPEKANGLVSSQDIQLFLNEYDVTGLDRIIFVGSGSSHNITLVAQKLFEEYAQVVVESYTPTQFLDKNLNKYSRDNVLVIAISQTGTSSGTVQSIQYAKEQGFQVLTMTEREDTPVQREGDFYLNFRCGLEDSNAKTKGYINSLIILQMLAMGIAKEKELVSKDEYASFMHELKESIQEIPQTLETTLEWLSRNKDWATIHSLLVIGYGTNYGSAIEGMLKILETLGVLGSACELGEFSHGYHRTLTSTSAVISIQSEEPGIEEAMVTNQYIQNLVKKTLIVNACLQMEEGDNAINVACREFTLSSINIAIVFQVIAAFLPEVIGYDPNRKLNEDLTELVKTRVV